jgi:hypothetical protein
LLENQIIVTNRIRLLSTLGFPYIIIRLLYSLRSIEHIENLSKLNKLLTCSMGWREYITHPGTKLSSTPGPWGHGKLVAVNRSTHDVASPVSSSCTSHTFR